MALLKFFIPSTGAGDHTPAVAAGWTGASGMINRKLVTTKISSAQSTITTSTGTTGSEVKCCIYQGVSEAQTAREWTTADKVRMQILMNKGSGLTTGYLHVIIRVVSADGSTVRGTLYDGSGPTDGAGYPLTNRALAAGGGWVNIQNSVSQQANDHIVVEFGAKQYNTSPWDGCAFKVKDNHDADLPENETTQSVDESTDHDPFIEFDQAAAGQAIVKVINE